MVVRRLECCVLHVIFSLKDKAVLRYPYLFYYYIYGHNSKAECFEIPACSGEE